MGGRGNMNARSGKYHGKGGKGTNRNGQGQVYKFHPYSVNSGKKFATYTSVVKKIKLRVSKDLKFPIDIIQSIEDKSLLNMEKLVPRLMISYATDEETKAREEIENKMRYEIELR